MKKRGLLIILVCLSFTLLLSGCSKTVIDNNAQILNDNATELINSDFYKSNYTRGALYDDYEASDIELPASRYFIIKTQDEFQTVFSSNADFDIDFQSDMIVVCTFTSVYIRPAEIDFLKISSDRIDLELSLKNKNQKPFGFLMADATRPFQRYVVIKMEKADVSEINLKIK